MSELIATFLSYLFIQNFTVFLIIIDIILLISAIFYQIKKSSIENTELDKQKFEKNANFLWKAFGVVSAILVIIFIYKNKDQIMVWFNKNSLKFKSINDSV